MLVRKISQRPAMPILHCPKPSKRPAWQPTERQFISDLMKNIIIYNLLIIDNGCGLIGEIIVKEMLLGGGGG